MTKLDLIKKVAEQTGNEKGLVSDVVEATVSTIMKSMVSGKNIYIRGFGTFAVVIRKQKKGRIISKGIPVLIPAQRQPKFKPCKEFIKKVASYKVEATH